MRCFVLLIAFFLILPSYAEEIIHPELRNLFEADLVVDANFKSQDKRHFYITVNESIKGEQYGIKKGDQLKLLREENGCGMMVDFSNYTYDRYYLKKVPNGWRLNYNSAQSIKPVNQFANLIQGSYCGLSSGNIASGKTRSIHSSIKEFSETYQFEELDQRYIPDVDSLTLLARTNTNELIAAFEKCGRVSLDCVIVEELEYQTAVENGKNKVVLPIQACELMYHRAEHPFSHEEMEDFRNKNENPLADEGIHGRVIAKLSINEYGEISDVEILRSVHPLLDSLAREKAFRLPPWKAAEDHNGRKSECFSVMPFSFK